MSKVEQPERDPRLITRPVASRYLGGETPERFGVNPIQGKRQRLYDRRAIDAALDHRAGLTIKDEEPPPNPLEALLEEWR